jgi:hypothetical protein
MIYVVKATWNRFVAFLYREAWRREDGMGTVEIVIIIAVLVGLALIFRDAILNFASGVMESLFANDQINNEVDVYNIKGDFGVG